MKAAIGVVQLSKLDAFIDKYQENSRLLNVELKGFK